MSEPFDLELFLAGKRLWDEARPWTVENAQVGAAQIYCGQRVFAHPLTHEERQAVHYFANASPPEAEVRDALAAEILRLRAELKLFTYGKCPRCAAAVPNTDQLCNACKYTLRVP